jgi:hypothetical protein
MNISHVVIAFESQLGQFQPSTFVYIFCIQNVFSYNQPYTKMFFVGIMAPTTKYILPTPQPSILKHLRYPTSVPPNLQWNPWVEFFARHINCITPEASITGMKCFILFSL